MTDQDKRDEPGGDSTVGIPDRAAAAKDISMALRELKKRAEAQDLKMVAYLLNLAELEALDCAGAIVDSQRASESRSA